MNLKNMTKILSILLVFALMLTLAACGGQSSSSGADASGSDSASVSDSTGGSSADQSSSEPAAPTAHTAQEYGDAIRDARSAEDNEYDEIYAREADGMAFLALNPNGVEEDAVSSMMPMMLETLGLSDDMITTSAFSMSMMNVRAYFIGIFMPAEGRADDVKAALEEYVKLQQQSFEQYLEDQYEIAKDAKIEQLSDGSFAVVMAENSGDILAALQKAL